MRVALILTGLLALAALYVLPGSGLDMDYVIPRRLGRLAAMVICGIAVAFSSITFQTLTGNRILTPSIMGYEAVYLMWQSLMILSLGTASLRLMGTNGNFITSIMIMLAWSLALHRWLFRDGRNNVWLLLLVGLVLTMVITTFTQFVQLRISPGEFAVFQSFAQMSFDRVDSVRLVWSAALLALVIAAGWRSLRVLDVLALGRDQAISLGVDHRAMVRFLLALISVLVAVSTSLIGPSAFMGIFVANVAYLLAPDARHRRLLPIGAAIAIAMFLIAQIMVEQVFDSRTTVGILINLTCGVWFLALMLRSGRQG
ncbi:iron chelate uptake ABC transporter family permease subunit [Paracoccus caeni]|uniref:Iron chelate uptake ABC transporter family permease subunit n=1 Tax=Paracoccus caeni TaxID=657651 RepID=A0A934S8E9_9RHOB|nr:iron chelate uptake ABC transporter family permease subunit [Paracoccus caeni]MBK4214310.1 iron chelate uptake ABC transporter family permease subunit [Paracoccus caeni]